jgi:4,5-dihydroxyphthalate decarboxylase
MKKLQLSIGVVSNPRTWPILNGTIEPDGIDLVPTVFREPHFGLETIPDMGVAGDEIYKCAPGSIAHRVTGGPGQLFARQLMYGDFDMSEMSMMRLMMSIAQGDDRWMGFPVFMSRRFFHMDILVRKDATIEKPEDLRGKNVGIATYQSVPAVWNRGMLQHDYGVHPREMIFWRDKEPDRGPLGFVAFPRFTPPRDVKVNDIPPGKTVLSMLKSGELQAALEAPGDAGHGPGIDAPEIRQLFPDVYGECVRYYQRTGLYPINHGAVIKREIVEKQPWAVLNLFNAFQQAAELADKQRMAHVGYHLESGLIPREAEKALQKPLARHGVAFNRKVLDTYLEYTYEQGITPRKLKLEEIYPPSLMDT